VAAQCAVVFGRQFIDIRQMEPQTTRRGWSGGP